MAVSCGWVPNHLDLGFLLSKKCVRWRNGPNNFLRSSNRHLILEGIFRQKQAISDDLQNTDWLLPALKNKALTNSDELWHNTFFRTPKRNAARSNRARRAKNTGTLCELLCFCCIFMSLCHITTLILIRDWGCDFFGFRPWFHGISGQASYASKPLCGPFRPLDLLFPMGYWYTMKWESYASSRVSYGSNPASYTSNRESYDSINLMVLGHNPSSERFRAFFIHLSMVQFIRLWI